MKAKLVHEVLNEMQLEEGRFGRGLATAAIAGTMALGAQGQINNQYPSKMNIMNTDEVAYSDFLKNKREAKKDGKTLNYDDWAEDYYKGKDNRGREIVQEKTIDLSWHAYAEAREKGTKLGYDEWVASHVITKNDEVITDRYQLEANKNVKSASEAQKGDILVYNGILKNQKKIEQQIVILTKNQITAGHYQVKGVNQILTGAGFAIAGAGVAFAGQQMAINYAEKWPNLSPEEALKGTNIRSKAGMYSGILLGVVGIGFEISGLLNLKNAGIALNPNGLTLTLDF